MSLPLDFPLCYSAMNPHKGKNKEKTVTKHKINQAGSIDIGDILCLRTDIDTTKHL